MLRSLLCIAMVSTYATVALADEKPNHSEEPQGVDKICVEAKAVQPLVASSIAKTFLDAAPKLPRIKNRKLYLDESTRTYYSPQRRKEIEEKQGITLVEKEVSERFFYTTKFGTPIAYVRALELFAPHSDGKLAGKRILDFGYGNIGQLRMLATCGVDAVGVDVDPLFRELYSQPEDQGDVPCGSGKTGHVKIIDGRFPEIASEVGGGYDLITSKNTLKNGFFNPESHVPKERLVDLGVSLEEFAKTIHKALKPGGVFLIYNICPAPSKPEEPYKHWADGRSPFSKEMLEATGFKVVSYNANDDKETRRMAKALGWAEPDRGMDLENDLFGTYTIAIKK
ncbi:MAG: hypothetical protein DHS20C16_06450 [Phycisphaerae bacterium]|nr:MAG: hypothetical protein DHS20C16_06450 [Phycisphaerae bacterium]